MNIVFLIIIGLHLWGFWAVYSTMRTSKNIPRKLWYLGAVIATLNMGAALYWSFRFVTGV